MTASVSPRGLRGRLQAWVGSSLVHRLAALTTQLALVVLVPATVLSMFLSWRLVERDLEARLHGQAELHAARVAMALEAARGVLTDLTHSPLLGTTLVDAAGWQQYGAPFLRSLHIPVPVPTRLALCDFRGRVLASSGEPPTLEPHDWVEPVIGRGEWLAEIHAAPAGDHLLLLAPIHYAGTGTVEGAVAAELPLAELGVHAFQGAYGARLVGVDGRMLTGDGSGWSGRRWVEVPVATPAAFDGLGLRVQVAVPLWLEVCQRTSIGARLVHPAGPAVDSGNPEMSKLRRRRAIQRLVEPASRFAGPIPKPHGTVLEPCAQVRQHPLWPQA